jgi:protein-S-isoprenylcysteine O-methyltransferase Ste14
MKRSKVSSFFVLILPILVLAGVVLSHLALTDIYHGVEQNLETEWWIVRVTFILVFVLSVISLVLFLKMLRKDDG